MKAAADRSRYAVVAGAAASAIWLGGLLAVGGPGSGTSTEFPPVPVQLVEGADWRGEAVDPTLIKVLVNVGQGAGADRTGLTSQVAVLRPADWAAMEGSDSTSS